MKTEPIWIYGEPPVSKRGDRMFMLTRGKIAVIGQWGNCVGVIAWFPIPHRDKKQEQKLEV